MEPGFLQPVADGALQLLGADLGLFEGHASHFVCQLLVQLLEHDIDVIKVSLVAASRTELYQFVEPAV